MTRQQSAICSLSFPLFPLYILRAALSRFDCTASDTRKRRTEIEMRSLYLYKVCWGGEKKSSQLGADFDCPLFGETIYTFIGGVAPFGERAILYVRGKIFFLIILRYICIEATVVVVVYRIDVITEMCVCVISE